MRLQWICLVGSVLTLLVASPATAQRLTKFQELTRAMQGHLQPMKEVDPEGKLVNCNARPPAELDATPGPSLSQWIYNGGYQWKTVALPEGNCIFLQSPFKRGLTVEEAQMLLSAHNRQWPVDHSADKPLTPDQELHVVPRDKLVPESMKRDVPCDKSKGDKNCDQPPAKSDPHLVADPDDHRLWFDDVAHNIYPWNAMALVELVFPGGNAQYSSATQISPYVWVTAAHTIYQASTHTRWSGHKVRPSWKLPTATAPLSVTAVIDEDYTIYSASDEHSDIHDIGFFRSNQGYNIAQYPTMYVVAENHNCFDLSYSHVGSSNCDPYYTAISGFPTFYGYSGPTTNDYSFVHTAGYPYVVSGIDNTLQNFRPYEDNGAYLAGAPLGYELYTPQAPGVQPVIGLYSYVSEGDSGGPIFSQRVTIPPIGNVIYRDVYLVGVNTAYLSIDPRNNVPPKRYALGSGKGIANTTFFETNRNWTPGYPIMLTVPPEGAIYDSQTIPNFIGSATDHTSELKWASSIDGDLGTGGSDAVNGVLSPGDHTITVTLGTAPTLVQSEDFVETVPYGQEIRHITVTAAPAFLSAPPNPVPFGYDQSPKTVAMNWLSTAYPYVDLKVSVNNGVPQQVTSGITSGSFSATIERNKTYKYFIYRAGRTV